jgi:DUF1680 family protein
MEPGTEQAPNGVPRTPGQGAGTGPVCPTSAALARLWPIGLRDVVLAEGSALGDWQQRNSAKTLTHCIDKVVTSGAVRNLERVAEGGSSQTPHEGMHFSDSDIYKVLEAAAWDSVRGVSTQVADFVEGTTSLLARAQRDDGYLHSWVQGQHPDLAWRDLRWGHELYCAGHLLQAAVAEGRTGSGHRLATVAGRLVEHLLKTFSLEDGDGRLVGVCGHPLIETALVEFYRMTGSKAALKLAQRQVDLRGRPDVELPTTDLTGGRPFPLSYFLHHMPVRKRSLATGHAVRELYLQAGIVDVATETGDEELLSASETIWEDLFSTKTYLTGAHGSRHRDESIGDAYELPSDRAYAETCAAIASFQWNWRLLLATGRARYADAMEHVFWNTIAGSVSREGTEFFYSNTLHLRTDHDSADEDSPSHRLEWYECACCPPNLARLMASIQAYLVTRDASGLQLHMPFSGTVSTEVPGGTVELVLRTGHPWEGATEIEVTRCSATEDWTLSLRVPERTRKHGMELSLNGRPFQASLDGSYMKVTRRWQPGDSVRVSEPMPVRVLQPHWRLDAVRDCLAVQRGPLVYCLEAEDLDDGVAIEDVALDQSRPPEPSSDVPVELEGYVQVALMARGKCFDNHSRQLYEDESANRFGAGAQALTLVPYFARGNRARAAMRVWVPALRQDGSQ